MARRLTVVITGLVSAALLLAGLGGLALSHRAAARDAEQALLRQVEGLVTLVDDEALSQRAVGPVRTAVRQALDLSGFDLVALGRSAPPVGVDAGAFADAAAGRSSTYRRAGELVAVVPSSDGTVAVIGARDAPQSFPAGPWLLLSSALVLGIAAAVALGMARRLTAPLRQVEAVAGRIAAGDLSARVEPAGDDEIADLGRSVDVMARALEDAQATQRGFLLSVSHDLRTPLTAIRGFGELLTEDDDPEHARIGARIEAESRRLERLVADLLDLARFDAHGPSVQLAPVDLVDVAEGVVESLRPAAETAGLRLDVDAGDPVVVSGDADRLAQALANLVENALGFAAARIVVRVRADGGVGTIAVEDDGPGIADDVLPQVFDRLRTTRPRQRSGGPGSGLGLTIARELAEAMGGRATAGSGPSGGATVALAIPLHARAS